MAEDSVDEVCEFLDKRGLDQDVVAKFRSEKMDVEAVRHSTDDVLEDLGLTKTGDRVSLRAFCQTIPVTEKAGESKESKKRSLLEAFFSRKKKRGQPSKRAVPSHPVKPAKDKTRKIQLGWFHWNEKTGKFQSVRLLKGGGSREVDMPVEATKDEIVAECMTLFFPNGSSKFLGKATNMDFGLANFKTEAINDSVIVAGSEVPFTLLNYLEAHKTLKVRLYLTSRCKPIATLASEVTCNQSGVGKPADSACSSDDEDGLKPMLTTETKLQHTCHSTLIGSSEQRFIIKSEQDNAYFASLAKDKADDEARREAIEREIMEWQRKESLRHARGLRVPNEPNSPCITVQVRHPTMGLLRRGFSPSDTMMAVYDWVGSQTPDPEYFELHSNSVKCLPASMSVVEVDRQALYMAECDVPPSISDEVDDQTVEFRGFGQLLNCSAATVEHLGAVCVGEQLPEHFMDGDSSSGDDTIDYVSTLSSSQDEAERRKSSVGQYARGRNFREMVNNGLLESRDLSSASESHLVEEAQEDNSDSNADENPSTVPSEVPQLVTDNHEASNVPHISENVANGIASRNIRIVRLRRSLVLQDLIKEFLDDKLMTCELKIIMVDGQGNDERGLDVRGIYRDALSSFWQEFYISCSLGERGRVPFLRHDFQADEWAAVGRIISKGYLDLGYFPVMLSKAFFISAMLGEKAVSDEILLQSFNEYLAPIEEQVVCEALRRPEDAWNCGDKDDEEDEDKDKELTELLDRFECRKLPTKENIKSLMLEVAHKEIIQKAQYVADCWNDIFRESLADSKLSRLEGVCSLYKSLEPTTKKVLRMIVATPGNNAERSALDFLKRFIRGLDVQQLKCLLMFVTGADVICVSTIDVAFTKLEGLGRRPVAHTCSSVLELPSTYDSYAEFRAEFTNVLASGKWQNDIM